MQLLFSQKIIHLRNNHSQNDKVAQFQQQKTQSLQTFLIKIT